MMTVEQIMWCAQHRSVATYYQAEQEFSVCDWRRADELHQKMPSQFPCRWEYRLLVDTKSALKLRS